MTGSIQLLLAFTCGLSASLVGSDVHAQRSAVETPGVEQNYLLSQPMAEFPGKNVVVFTGHFDPGASTPIHRHPGTEFVFVLEGRGEMLRPGRAPVPLEPGVMVLSEPDPGERGFTHQARNLSETDGLKTLVIVIQR